ncbi:MAG: hypothetical protein QNJ90_06700 [Planctomycetota bacterium]|nr:hypothetical protein [Planctomycetota bacterium]
MAKLSLVVAILALAVAGWALSKAPGPLLSAGSGMDAYDFSTPEAAWRSGLEIEKAADMQAMMEFSLTARKEQTATAKLEEAVPFGKHYILFISHKEDGKMKYVTRGMKKVHGMDIWAPDYIGSYRVARKDKDLAKRMEAWEKKSK